MNQEEKREARKRSYARRKRIDRWQADNPDKAQAIRERVELSTGTWETPRMLTMRVRRLVDREIEREARLYPPETMTTGINIWDSKANTGNESDTKRVIVRFIANRPTVAGMYLGLFPTFTDYKAWHTALLDVDISKKQRDHVWERDRSTCQGCKRKLHRGSGDGHIHHKDRDHFEVGVGDLMLVCKFCHFCAHYWPGPDGKGDWHSLILLGVMVSQPFDGVPFRDAWLRERQVYLRCAQAEANETRNLALRKRAIQDAT